MQDYGLGAHGFCSGSLVISTESSPNNKGYSGGEERVSDYAHWLNKPGR
jgi:hypothetical protein